MGRVGVDMENSPIASGAQSYHEDSRNEDVDRDDENHGSDHGFSGGAAHALSATFGCQAVIAADCGHDEAEDKRLCEAGEYVRELESLPGAAPILMGIQFEHAANHECAAHQAEEISQDGQEEEHHDGGYNARGDELLHGIGAKRAHGIDLLSDDH